MWGAPQLTPEPRPNVSMGVLGWTILAVCIAGILGVCVVLGFY